jgi:hypothetical protein
MFLENILDYSRQSDTEYTAGFGTRPNAVSTREKGNTINHVGITCTAPEASCRPHYWDLVSHLRVSIQNTGSAEQCGL